MVGSGGTTHPAMRLLAERNRIIDWFNAQPDWGPEREDERLAVLDRAWEMVDQIIDGAEPSRESVLAKLQLVLRAWDVEELQLSHEAMISVIRSAFEYVRGH